MKKREVKVKKFDEPPPKSARIAACLKTIEPSLNSEKSKKKQNKISLKWKAEKLIKKQC